LKHLYFESERDDDGKLQLRKQYKDWFVTYEPADDLTNHNAWRQAKFLQTCTLQLILVVLAVLLGGYSYLAIARDIETEAAVQDGMEVLKGIGYVDWCLFAAYNIIVLLYFWKSLISTIKSGYNYILFFLYGECCKSIENENLETTFKPTWNRTDLEKHDVAMFDS